jgi:hypothetical protein
MPARRGSARICSWQSAVRRVRELSIAIADRKARHLPLLVTPYASGRAARFRDAARQ